MLSNAIGDTGAGSGMGISIFFAFRYSCFKLLFTVDSVAILTNNESNFENWIYASLL
jgi:hypothetical protein